ncbi:uncharacterized protein LOC131150625 isoform X1 [Malania oleifera]|uniref:uncharacterized protein LOC131150625 isoform X1 n=1 Tax=Malania oleifera TaxID=397392 RepID=UPI0025ADC9DA|nr:uncharacterized protein LOC131150625 isoform X1 [Malania oleifera]XP_057957444.1 uncharacterized protein LOC131150625 isoform X1 [Malania oleifera]XP_057957445.1 uncharacterized protein LOC131150625 isoform X1 [Malania oleifera]XP_057957446.1 uncharacterized protein LOC131150625 isoform X1 [Malania oleifera]XP_057957447.1 uncharacterized protein LOC131150625 isoform X1 [Malania oleifera]XP_057957448.1 uncharacterized protein LOC131150625 isoform X1 [Malania oleifera]
MEGGESILDVIYEEDNLENVEDIEMIDVEEGECVELNSQPGLGQNSCGDIKVVNQEPCGRSRRRRENKRRNKKKKSGSMPNVTDINRFVIDTCKRLKERKSYLIWTAVGCLGVSALSNLVKEVDAIQVCGGQMTADGRRHRTGGGILWSILKTQEPQAYQEIMKRGREFEKQFRQQNIKQATENSKGVSSKEIACAPTDQGTASVSDGSQPIPGGGNPLDQSNSERERVSVHDRIRVPVSYDDVLGEDQNDG